MIRLISWTHFFTVVGALIALYYIVITLVFFRKKILGGGRQGRAPGMSFRSIASSSEGEDPANRDGLDTEQISASAPADQVGEPDLYPVANELVETIDEFIVKAGKSQMVKEEVVYGIHRLIGEYPMLRVPGFKIAINNYIGIALKNNCPFGLDDAELAGLWVEEKKT